MSVTVAEFAAHRGMTRQGVYKAIKRYEIPTFQGVSNGKATQFMSDEDAQWLNDILGPTESSNLILKQNLELQIQTERERLVRETADKVEAALREKETEITRTRAQMMDRIETGVSDMRQMVDEVRADFEKALKDKEKHVQLLEDDKAYLLYKIKKLEDEKAALHNELIYAQNHPYRNLKEFWDKKKEAKKDGKPTENH